MRHALTTFAIWAFLCSFVALGFLRWLTRPALSEKECRDNLERIGKGLSGYMARNNGFLPDREGVGLLSVLYESGRIEDPRIFLCPYGIETPATRTSLDPSSCSYVGRDETRFRLHEGRGGWGPRTILAADWTSANHGGFRNVLFAGGHVEEIDESVYQATYSPVMGR